MAQLEKPIMVTTKKFLINEKIYSITLHHYSSNEYEVSISSNQKTNTYKIGLINQNISTSSLIIKLAQQCFKAHITKQNNLESLVSISHHLANLSVQEIQTPQTSPLLFPASIVLDTKATHIPEKQVDDSSSVLKSPLGGRVIKIFIQEGDWVKENQPLCTIESMKMENEICSPFNAHVKTLSIVPGNVVQQSQVLITFEKKGRGDATPKNEYQQKEISHR